MRISYYDDGAVHRDIIQKNLTNWSISRNIDVKIGSFKSAQDLVESELAYDLLILDIQLENNLNGIDVGQTLRNNGYKGLIVLLTSSESHMREGYEIETFRYVVKPVSQAMFFKVIDDCYEKLRTDESKIGIEYNGIQSVVPIRDIIFIESNTRIRKVYLLGEVIKTKETLISLQQRLPTDSFIVPHKSFLINMRHVMKVSKSNVYLRDGKEIVISRKNKDLFASSMHKYMMNQ